MGRKWGIRGEPVTLRLPAKVLAKVDELVQSGKFSSRSAVFDEAVKLLVKAASWGFLYRVKDYVKAHNAQQEQNDAIISVRLPRVYENYLDDMVAGGAFASRSEAIKTALLYFLEPEGEES